MKMDNELIKDKNWWSSNWKWVTIVAAFALVGFFIVKSAAKGLKSEPQNEISFDTTKWQKKKGLDYPYRLNMLNDLMTSDTLKILKKEEIINLLGQPDRMDKEYLFYRIAQKRVGLFPLTTKTLVIKLANDGTKNKVMTHG